ncbi:hypothetical protein DPMN_101702 [Dreissena polymorpha]|uniref:Uncharacterized protein n=1 Tax=Dreissena polymorpha TaxID=45954 RepID=A0A9D4LJF2_DREPO|nr:hypothetical protein DPMN_101702 [Dreissena polymorpha]
MTGTRVPRGPECYAGCALGCPGKSGWRRKTAEVAAGAQRSPFSHGKDFGISG